MKREKEIALLDELLGLREARSAFLDETVTRSPVARYTEPGRFDAERARLFHRNPVLLAHASEMAGDGDFLLRELAGMEVLLTRDRDGAVHAFRNTCRHRGMRLVADGAGCRHRFTCPYHAWTWDNRGRLIGVPHREQGFPDMDMAAYGLSRLAIAERCGWIWVQAEGEMDIDAHLAPLAGDFDWIGMEDLEVHAVTEREWGANWKMLVEGGLEAYHFRVAHAKTIAGLFHDNLSTYEMMGPHIRSVLARQSVDSLAGLPREQWSIREHTNLLYTMLPGAVFLVQADHVVLLQVIPRAVDRTMVRLATLRPREDARADYWDRNHALTEETLGEDFEIGAAVQVGFASGANTELTFGRYEGALDAFNRTVETALGAGAEPRRLHG